MSRSSSGSAFGKAASATGIVGAVAFSVLAGGMSASAAPIDCAAVGATTIAPGICQIVVTTTGTFSIGAPVGVTVTHLEALLVAGGTAGAGYDGGYGGEVVYVNNVPLTPLTVTIGAGGVAGVSAATPTVVTDGATQFTEADPTITSINGTAGVLPSTLAASALFPAYAGEQFVAGDGLDGDEFVTPPADGTDWTPAGGGTYGSYADARPSSGSGGAGFSFIDNPITGVDAGDGANGIVIFRFAAPEAAVSPALAATGTDATVAASAAGVLLLGGTAALVANRRRRARA